MGIDVIGFDHWVLKCADVEASLAFYVDTLGLAPVRVDDWMRGDAPFPSARVSATTIVDFFPEPPSGSNLDHICLVIAHDVLDQIEETFPDARRADGLFGAQGYAASVYITDPDGNTVELRCYSSPDT